MPIQPINTQLEHFTSFDAALGGQRIVFGGRPYCVLIEQDQIIPIFKESSATMMDVTFSPNGQFVVGGAHDGKLYCYDCDSNKAYLVGQSAAAIEKIDATLFPLIIVASESTLYFWNAETSTYQHSIQNPDGLAMRNILCYEGQNRINAVVGYGYSEESRSSNIVIWDYETQRVLMNTSTHYLNRMIQFRDSLVFGFITGVIEVVAMEENPFFLGNQQFWGHHNPDEWSGILSLSSATIHGEPVLVSGSANGTAKISRIEADEDQNLVAQEIVSIQQDDHLWRATYLEDINHFLTVGENASISFWDIQTGQKVHYRPSHLSNVKYIGFNAPQNPSKLIVLDHEFNLHYLPLSE